MPTFSENHESVKIIVCLNYQGLSLYNVLFDGSGTLNAIVLSTPTPTATRAIIMAKYIKFFKRVEVTGHQTITKSFVDVDGNICDIFSNELLGDLSTNPQFAYKYAQQLRRINARNR